MPKARKDRDAEELPGSSTADSIPPSAPAPDAPAEMTEAEAVVVEPPEIRGAEPGGTDADVTAPTAQAPLAAEPSVVEGPAIGPMTAMPDASILPMPERELHGLHYLEVIAEMCRVLQPERYFEIGTDRGLSLARVPCRAVAVDPAFKLATDVVGSKPACMLFQMTSDRFFEQHDVKALLGGPIQLAFLDGMHRFEFLLRDFINTERNSQNNSLILLHDCFPVSVQMAERRFSMPGRLPPEWPAGVLPRKSLWSHPAFWWTGDVWKVLWILSQYRPDLTVLCLDSAPTGLVAITGLDPSSTVLTDRYFSIVHQYGSIETTAELLDEHYRRYPLISATDMAKEEHLTRCFWF